MLLKLGRLIVLGPLLVACGGRQANLAARETSLDSALRCEHLQGERVVNEARIDELIGERSRRTQNNVGFVLASPLFLDLSDTEKRETAALVGRNQRLDELARERNCLSPPGT